MKSAHALWAGVLLAAAAWPAASPVRAASRPNLLFIYTDDQRYDALSVVQQEQGDQGRFPWFRTPHMDRLASEGVCFRNAFVVHSLCAPSRAVNLTGRYGHFNGVASNFRPLPVDSVTHASLLRGQGYRTAYVGKWHMDSQRERPGFDHHASFIGHARYNDPVFIVDGRDVPTRGWIDDISTDYALEFLRRQKERPEPWLLIVGFKSPHGPFDPPARAKDRFAGEQARPTPNLNVPAPYMGAAGSRRAEPSPAAVPVNLNYFRCISAADDCLGRLLDGLDELGMARNTVVIYTSDNGYYLGEHGLGDKRSAYDESLRVPLLVRYPALGDPAQGRVRDEMVLNLDLAPTLLDWAGAPIPAGMQGRSWRPLVAGQKADWRTSWFYEYFAERQRNSRVPDITAVRTAGAKLIKYPGHDDWTELFDLAADPFETRNVFRDPARAELLRRLEAEHDRLALEVGYRVPEYVDRPEWWGRAGGADWQPDAKPELRLELDAAHFEGGHVLDASGKGNHGAVLGVVLADGRSGRKAMRWQDGGCIEVGKSASLNPAGQAWTVEAMVRPGQPDGVILARGGRSQGYALWLDRGRPAFTVVAGNQRVTVQAKSILDDWAVLAGIITADRQARIYVNGQLAGSAPLPGLIGSDPMDIMQIGADLGSPVIEPVPPRWTGWMEWVRIYSGEAAIGPLP